jgi:hypothetical protein
MLKLRLTIIIIIVIIMRRPTTRRNLVGFEQDDRGLRNEAPYLSK